MENPIILKCKPNVLEIYSYLMYHSFNGKTGAIRLSISVLFLLLAIVTVGEVEWFLTLLLIFVGILNPVVTPGILYMRALKMANQASETIYELDQENVLIAKGGTRKKIPWTVFPLIVWGRYSVILYIDHGQALLLPFRQMKDKQEKVLELLLQFPHATNLKFRKRADRIK